MVPGLSPDEPGSAKELVYGISKPFASGQPISLVDLPVPSWKEAGRTPANPSGQSARLNLIAVYAVRVVLDSECAPEKKDGSLIIAAGDDTFRDAVFDITSHTTDRSTFTPPNAAAGETWVLVAVYYRGTLQVGSTLGYSSMSAYSPSQSKSHFEQNADTYTQELAHVVDHLSEEGVDVLAVSLPRVGITGC